MMAKVCLDALRSRLSVLWSDSSGTALVETVLCDVLSAAAGPLLALHF